MTSVLLKGHQWKTGEGHVTMEAGKGWLCSHKARNARSHPKLGEAGKDGRTVPGVLREAWSPAP